MLFRELLIENLNKYTDAHLTAQKNAALPIEKGGLGLHPNNTAHERAKALGFNTDTPMYRGISQDYDHTKNSPVIWTTDSPAHASVYTDNGKDGYGGHVMKLFVKSNHPMSMGFRNIEDTQVKQKEVKGRFKDRIMSAYENGMTDVDTAKKAFKNIDNIPETDGYKLAWEHRNSHPAYHESIKSVGYDSYEEPETYGKTHKTIGVFSPHQLRSVHAAFDPMRKDEHDLLA